MATNNNPLFKFCQKRKFSRNNLSLSSFTLIELLVVIVIVGMLAGILLPVLGRIREQGRRVQCLNNLRQHGMAWYLYLDDHGDCFPPYGAPASDGRANVINFGGKKGVYGPGESAQYRVLNRYLEIKDETNPNLKLFYCPDDIKPNSTTLPTTNNTFGYNGNSYIANDTGVLMFGAGMQSPRPLISITRARDRVYLEMCNTANTPGHGGKGPQSDNETPVMVLFVDGHVAGSFLYNTDFEWLSRDDNKKVFIFSD